MTRSKRNTKRWKYIGSNPLSGDPYCVTDTELSWCAIKIEMHDSGEDPELVARAIAGYLNTRFPKANRIRL